MSDPSPSRFVLRGQFAGFIRTLDGKRRMVLKTDDGELLLKIPKELRHDVQHALVPGQPVAVTGVEERDSFTDRIRRLVGRIQPLGVKEPAPVACVHCPIEVCAKKNCWKAGGREVFQALEAGITAAGLGESVTVKSVRCLDECKRAPVLAWGRHVRTRITPQDVPLLLAQIADELGLPAPSGPR